MDAIWKMRAFTEHLCFLCGTPLIQQCPSHAFHSVSPSCPGLRLQQSPGTCLFLCIGSILWQNIWYFNVFICFVLLTRKKCKSTGLVTPELGKNVSPLSLFKISFFTSFLVLSQRMRNKKESKIGCLEKSQFSRASLNIHLKTKRELIF